MFSLLVNTEITSGVYLAYLLSHINGYRPPVKNHRPETQDRSAGSKVTRTKLMMLLFRVISTEACICALIGMFGRHCVFTPIG